MFLYGLCNFMQVASSLALIGEAQNLYDQTLTSGLTATSAAGSGAQSMAGYGAASAASLYDRSLTRFQRALRIDKHEDAHVMAEMARTMSDTVSE